MSNEEKQQNINNIKSLSKLSNEGVVPSLFREVKYAKQQVLNMLNSLREKANAVRREEEGKARAEALRVQAQKRLATVQQDRSGEKSFAELFEQSTDKQVAEEPKESIQKVEEKKVEVQEKPAEKVVEKPVVEKKEEPKPTYQQPKVQKPVTQNRFVQQDRYQGNKPRYTQQQSGQPQRVGANNGFRPYNNYPMRNDKTRPFQQNRPFGSNQQRPFGASQGQGQGQGRFAKPMGASGQVRAQNKALTSIIPRRNAQLESATTAFASKERTFGNKKKSNERVDTEKRINKKSLLRRGLIEEANIEERMVTRKLKLKKPKTDVAPVVCAPITNAVITTNNLTVKMLSEKIGKPVTEIIKQLMILGIMTTINSTIDFATAELVASELGVTLELKLEKTYEEKLKENAIDDGTNTEKRAPIVTIVGHVDHGKTSLLDYIRKTHVTSSEAGGITQSIGAYSINWKGEDITFIDTPGHEAFINMRKRGTEITDIAVLIVAGDDGVKPQTIEAIKHIKEAKAPMIVAITKIDKQNVDIDRIKQQLAEQDVLPEDWGGDAIVVPVSSVTGQGIDQLLETILLVAEMQELKCNRERNAVGTIVEATLDKNRGPIANIIVQNGTLKIGDSIVSGFALGKVRALVDSRGRNVQKAGPSTPVSVLGFDSVPKAGDSIQAVDEKFSKNVIEERRIKMAQEKIEHGAGKSLDEFLATPIKEDMKTLNLLIKADSQGSAEALKQSLGDIKNEEVEVKIVSCGVGNINENDVQLAKVSGAIIISFDTKVLGKISTYAKQNKVEIKQYDIIYKVIEDIEKLAKSMMAPKFEEKVVGHAEVRALFKISSVGTIAGSYVLDGKIVRNSSVKITRGGKEIFSGKIATLKRGKDDAKEVASGYECGIKIDGFNDVQEGDIIESIVREQIFS